MHQSDLFFLLLFSLFEETENANGISAVCKKVWWVFDYDVYHLVGRHFIEELQTKRVKNLNF